MTDDAAVLTPDEVAQLLRVRVSVVRRMVRDKRLAKVPGLRPVRILRRSVDALLGEGYDAADVQSTGQASTQAPVSKDAAERLGRAIG